MGPSTLWNALALKNVERRVAAYPPSESGRMRALFRAASDRAQAADGIVEGHVASALVLYRQAALLYMAAFLAIGSSEPSEDQRLPFDVVLGRFRAALHGRSPFIDDAKLQRFVEATGADPLAIDRLEPERAFAIGQDAREIVDVLGRLVEPRTVGEIRFARGARLSGLGLALGALCIGGALIYGESGNIALHKPTSSSGLHPKAVMAPGGLTDGITDGAYGIHTDVSDNPWVQVDLQAVFKIDRVKIYNRGDYELDAGLPMTLQLSENGTTFVDIETRRTSFGQVVPWTAHCHGTRARYVRVHGTKGKYVALAEVKVFGRKP